MIKELPYEFFDMVEEDQVEIYNPEFDPKIEQNLLENLMWQRF